MEGLTVRFLKKAFFQSCLIIGVAFAISMIYNSARSNGLPIFKKGAVTASLQESQAEMDLAISIEEARVLYLSDRAIFVDARPKNQYLRGHIRGALSLPLEDLDNIYDKVKSKLSKDRIIITYCDGLTCNLGEELALELMFRGYKNVRFLKNGWTEWQKARLPVVRQ